MADTDWLVLTRQSAGELFSPLSWYALQTQSSSNCLSSLPCKKFSIQPKPCRCYLAVLGVAAVRFMLVARTSQRDRCKTN